MKIDCLKPILVFQCPFFCSHASDKIKPIIILLTLGVKLRRSFSLFVNLDFKLGLPYGWREFIPICLFDKVNSLQEVLVFIENFFFNKKLILEKDLDEGYTLNDVHNEMAHVAAVK